MTVIEECVKDMLQIIQKNEKLLEKLKKAEDTEMKNFVITALTEQRERLKTMIEKLDQKNAS